jgi:hypothetical protein
MPREKFRIAPPSNLQLLDKTPVAHLGSTIPLCGAGKMTGITAYRLCIIEAETKFGSDKSNRPGEGRGERIAASNACASFPFARFGRA